MPRPPCSASENDPAERYAAELLQSCGLDRPVSERHLAADPSIDWADSGAMILTGDTDGPPRFAPGPIATAARGAGLALARLAPTGPLASLDAAALLAERAAIAGLERRGRSSAGGSAHLLRARDEWIVVNLPRDEDWRSLPAWLEVSPDSITRGDTEALALRVAGQCATRLVERGRLLGLAVAFAPRSIDSKRPLFRRSAPTEVHREKASRPPRILDLSSLWAGPLAASILAVAGFDVLKVEAPERPDGARAGPAAFFDLLNGGKSGCTIDLSASSQRQDFEALLEAADIVLESARPRSLEQFGYDAASWVSERAGRLWISITGYGREAPEREWIAFGDDAAIAAGLAWSPCESVSADGGEPCFCADAIADPLTGLHAAAVALAHWQAGRGGLLEFALAGVAAHTARFEAGGRSPALVQIENAEGSHREWGIETADGPRRLRRPRARKIVAKAPALTPLSQAFLTDWTSRC